MAGAVAVVEVQLGKYAGSVEASVDDETEVSHSASDPADAATQT